MTPPLGPPVAEHRGHQQLRLVLLVLLVVVELVVVVVEGHLVAMVLQGCEGGGLGITKDPWQPRVARGGLGWHGVPWN